MKKIPSLLAVGLTLSFGMAHAALDKIDSAQEAKEHSCSYAARAAGHKEETVRFSSFVKRCMKAR
jgi:hypothetical protein